MQICMCECVCTCEYMCVHVCESCIHGEGCVVHVSAEEYTCIWECVCKYMPVTEGVCSTLALAWPLSNCPSGQL